MSAFQLAQLNVGVPVAPLDSPQLEPFMAALDPVNARADVAPGFVWRLQADDGNATSYSASEAFAAVFDATAEDLILNLSVWESLETLRAFVYSDRTHLDILRRRREFFRPFKQAFTVLWWVPAGHIPTIHEATDRLLVLQANGPTPDAFTLRVAFAPPAAARTEPELDERDLCPAS